MIFSLFLLTLQNGQIFPICLMLECSDTPCSWLRARTCLKFNFRMAKRRWHRSNFNILTVHFDNAKYQASNVMTRLINSWLERKASTKTNQVDIIRIWHYQRSQTNSRSARNILFMYSKTCVKRPLSKDRKLVFKNQLLLNAGQKYCRMLQWEHSALLLTLI